MASLALQNIYNNYLTQFAPSATRYDTHKKDELKNVYRSIARQTKESPIFLPVSSEDAVKYAVGIKESARDLKNVIASLSTDNSLNLLDKKTAFSSDEGLATAKYIGEDSIDEEDVPSFELGVERLASKQVNRGRYINDGAMTLTPDTYSFDVNINDTDYEFQFNVESGDTNKDMEEKLARLINRSNIGVTASVESNESGQSALILESVATGQPADKDYIFSVSDDNTSKRAGAVNYFGLSDVTAPPENAKFTLNGTEHDAYSNSFTIDKSYEVTLNGVSEDGETTHIGLKPDVESLISNVKSLVEGYNRFIGTTMEFANAYGGSSNKFKNEITGIQNVYRNELDSIGLSFNADGELEIDEKYLRAAAAEGDPHDTLIPITDFTSEMLLEAKKISLNPMNYTDRIVVAYKNPGHNFSNPYVTSYYSGLMFNSIT